MMLQRNLDELCEGASFEPSYAARDRDVLPFDVNPIHHDMASLFAPSLAAASAGMSHVRHITPAPPRDRWRRGSVAILFALLAMLAGLLGAAVSRHPAKPARPAATRPVLAAPSPPPLPVAAAPAAPVLPAPAPVRLALSQPPSLPPIVEPAIRKAPAMIQPIAPRPALANAAASQRTPHLTGAALVRALAQDVIDTRRLNEGVLDEIHPERSRSR